MRRKAIAKKHMDNRIPYNLVISAEVKKAIKIWCIEHSEEPSAVTEYLWRKFLRQRKKES